MKRRFGRRRRSGGSDGGGGSTLDTGWLARIVAAGLVPVESLEPVEDEEVPARLALLGRGVDAEGRAVLVAFSPRDGGDALLALAAHRRRLAGARPDGGSSAGGEAAAPEAPHRAYVVSRFGAAARRRLAFLGELDLAVEPVEAGRLLEGPGIQPEPAPAAVALPPAQVGAGLGDPQARDLFGRALASLAGLAAKHAGGVRGTAAGVELVLMARRVARLSVRDEQVVLEVFENRASAQPLSAQTLSEAFDQLEGQLRKRLRDTRILRGEEGLRARVQPGLAGATGLRSLVPFPLGGSEGEVLDAVGVDEAGRVAVVAVREALNLEGVGSILDAWAELQPSLPGLLAGALPPVKLVEPPRLVVASVSCDAAAARVLEGLTLELLRLDIRAGRDGVPELVPAGSAPASAPAVGASRERAGRRRGRGRRGPRRTRDERGAGDDEGSEAAGPGLSGEAAPEAAGSGDPEPTGRAPRAARPDPTPGEESEERPRYAELSSFDLDDSFGLGAGTAPAARGRGRRRGRSRRRREEGDGAQDDDESEPAGDADASESEPIGLTAEGTVSDGAPTDEAPEEEDVAVDEEDLELAEAPEPEEEPEPMRQERPRRAAILAHGDRHSVASAMLLAREVRQVEGIWVYPQEELMTFFRSVTTDLRDDVTIIVVGFQASPVRDVLQAASLYSGRLEWYDTSEWPPEDLAEFSAALGSDFVDVRPGLDTPMPLVLPRCSRRSRFSDKLVDLASARFSEHDFQRWGRVWWWRLGEIASQPGEHKNELQPLLTGRPSDLAAEAGRAESPPLPPEVEFIAAHDCPIVHFGGYAMVLVEVPEGLDLSLAGRIARERYGAHLSLARHEGQGLAILGANDARTARPLAVGAMAQHLGEKLAWVETLPFDDHVARFRIHGLADAPEHLTEVVSEIGMGRSILEG